MTQNDILPQNLAKEIAAMLDSKKAEEIEIIDLSGRDYIAQFVVIATSMAGKHSLSLLHYMEDELRSRGVRFYAIDKDSEDWIIVDLGEVMVHIFTENHRKKYNIDEFLNKKLQVI